MTTIYHYTHRQDLINSDGYIRTERDLGVGAKDGFDMDYVWLTQQPTVCGASHSMLLIASENLVDRDKKTLDAFDDALHNHEHYNTPKEHCSYAFDSDTICAVSWPRARRKWVGVSPKKKAFADSIDYKSTFNGDNVADYWVAPHKVAVSDAVTITTITKTRRELFADLGIHSAQDVLDYTYTNIRPLVKRFPGMITIGKLQQRQKEQEQEFMNEIYALAL